MFQDQLQLILFIMSTGKESVKQSFWFRYFCCCWRRRIHNQGQKNPKQNGTSPKQSERRMTNEKFQANKDAEIEMKSDLPEDYYQMSIPQSPQKQSNHSNQCLLIEKQAESYRQQIVRLQEDILKMDTITHKTPQDQDNLAYTYANLTNLYILTNNNKYQETAQKALNIYYKRSNFYIEQIITLKNNLALTLQKQERIEEAIELYSQVLSMEDKFYSISDIRRLSTLNNIFCLYMKYKDIQKSIRIYAECEPILKTLDEGQQIRKLFRQNYEYYYPQIKEYEKRTKRTEQLK